MSQLLEISSKNFRFLKSLNSEFSCIDVYFTNQNSKALEIEDKINLSLVINSCAIFKMRYSIEPRTRIFVKGDEFSSFLKNMQIKLQRPQELSQLKEKLENLKNRYNYKGEVIYK